MASISTKFGLGGAGGTVLGAPQPTYITGRYYRSHLYTGAAVTLTTTATRIYYTPIYIAEAHTFTGCVTRNSGAGDNGETYRVGLYTHSASGPKTLVVDFGQVTLTGAVAERVLTASCAITTPGWYWFAVHHNTAAAMYGGITEGSFYSGAGHVVAAPFMSGFGNFLVASEQTGSGVNGFYVDTAYGALASTAVAPTADNTGAAVMAWLVG